MKTYVNWKGKKVEIPDNGYLPAGQPREYTPEKVASTLDFYHRQLLEGDLHEALLEEREERHHPDLLDTAVLRAITDIDEEGLTERLQLLLTRPVNQNP